MYSAYKLNKQGDNIQPDVLLFLFGASLLFDVQFQLLFPDCIQVSQEASQVVWYSHLFQNFPQFIVIHTVKVVKLANFYWASLSCQASTLKSFFPKVFVLSTAFGRQNVIETDILENATAIQYINYDIWIPSTPKE